MHAYVCIATCTYIRAFSGLRRIMSSGIIEVYDFEGWNVYGYADD